MSQVNKINIDEGIFFEGTNELLAWGKGVNQLIKQTKSKIIHSDDRTIINWGNHSILNGLNLDLTTTYLAPVLPVVLKKFRSIEYRADGDEKAVSEFERISKHLLKVIGEPVELIESSTSNKEKCLKWNIKSTSVMHCLYDQHVHQLELTIGKNRQTTL